MDHSLVEIAKKVRKETLDLAIEHGNGHIASALSIVEILVSLYYVVMKEGDRFILSKGHGCLSLYAVLRQRGFNPTILGHPDIDPGNGIECTMGSLGHGLPIGVGMALAKKIKKEKGRIYVLMGDGECQEGTTWESMLLCNKFGFDNLTVIVDCNGLQALDYVDNILPFNNLWAKFQSFDAYVLGVYYGHSIEYITDTLQMKSRRTKVILVYTTKGKGISFIENVPMWHSRLPEGELLEQAYRELE